MRKSRNREIEKFEKIQKQRNSKMQNLRNQEIKKSKNAKLKVSVDNAAFKNPKIISFFPFLLH